MNQLAEQLKGDVLVEGDPEYDKEVRLCFNLLIDRRPAVIARCVDADDVSAAMSFARENDLEIAVRGGGHNPAGPCAVDDGLVIRPDQDARGRGQSRRAGRALRRAAPPGSTSTGRPRPTASSPPAAWSARPASPASPSAAASGTSPPSTPSPATPVS